MNAFSRADMIFGTCKRIFIYLDERRREKFFSLSPPHTRFFPLSPPPNLLEFVYLCQCHGQVVGRVDGHGEPHNGARDERRGEGHERARGQGDDDQQLPRPPGQKSEAAATAEHRGDKVKASARPGAARLDCGDRPDAIRTAVSVIAAGAVACCMTSSPSSPVWSGNRRAAAVRSVRPSSARSAHSSIFLMTLTE